jgi:hypothetical protein
MPKTMIFKGADRSGLLEEFPPHADSLAGLLQDHNEFHSAIHDALAKHLKDTEPPFEAVPLYKPVMELFNPILDWENYDDESIVNWLFQNNDRKQKVQELFGLNYAAVPERFLEAVRAGQKLIGTNMQTIAAELAESSFVATYYYRDIAQLLCTTKATLSTEVLKARVEETGLIMLGAVTANDKTFCSATYMISHMHTHRFKSWTRKNSDVRFYNLGSVAFTLLTFAYLPAKVLVENGMRGEDLKKYYFFWKAVGSLLGLPDGLMPDDHIQGATLYALLLEKSEQYEFGDDAMKLKLAWSKAYG